MALACPEVFTVSDELCRIVVLSGISWGSITHSNLLEER